MRFTFNKAERLWGHRVLEQVHQRGKSIHTPVLKIIFLPVNRTESPPCRIAFSVPKKNIKKAVTRNLLKRRMREAYRLQKQILYEVLSEKEKSLDVFVIYTSREVLSYDEIYKNMTQALQTLNNKIN